MQISQIPSIGKDTTEKLASLSIIDTKDLKFISPEDLVRVLGIGVKKIINIYAVAGIPLNSDKISELNRMTENKKIEGKQFSKGRISIKAPTPVVDEYTDKYYALSEFLHESIYNFNVNAHEDDLDEIKESSYDKSLFEYGDKEYLVLTDREAYNKVKEYIKETIWAFNKDFLEDHMGNYEIEEDYYEDLKEIITQHQSLYENGNDALYEMIDDFDEFVQDAIDSDGRGHFLSSYDGVENEQGEHYIYRIN